MNKGRGANRNPYIFQFHKGTINTLPRGTPDVTHTSFQFHKGTINTHN